MPLIVEPFFSSENSDAPTSASISFSFEGHLPCRRISEDVEVTFDKTMSASELLTKKDLLSKRLDRIVGIPICVLGNPCPSALKGNGRSIAANHHGLIRDGGKGAATVEILRRRTHSAFPLEYREPLCDAVLWARKLKDEQDANCGRSRRLDFGDVRSGKEDEGSSSVRSKNLATRARKVLHLLRLSIKRRGLEMQTSGADRPELPVRDKEAPAELDMADGQRPAEIRGLSLKCMQPVEDSSELDSLLGFRAAPHGGVYGPLVTTSSSLINNFQLESSSAELSKNRVPALLLAKAEMVLCSLAFLNNVESSAIFSAGTFRPFNCYCCSFFFAHKEHRSSESSSGSRRR
ncbi:hypothetical protein KIN20_008979 [Parelaphostrongylus tenuis]|uniref:Uncharacterized protein n=1 Tax=Parelaphostrongylus tenuis TaxID=148309 RepID=A0AAD5MX86_PARTN|nr:hypothetical protein KIN20_008979 [Parelaphostrongylus tenuis]